MISSLADRAAINRCLRRITHLTDLALEVSISSSLQRLGNATEQSTDCMMFYHHGLLGSRTTSDNLRLVLLFLRWLWSTAPPRPCVPSTSPFRTRNWHGSRSSKTAACHGRDRSQSMPAVPPSASCTSTAGHRYAAHRHVRAELHKIALSSSIELCMTPRMREPSSVPCA